MTADVVLIAGILLVIVLLTLLASYNALVQFRQDVRLAWSRMDDQLKNRYALVTALTSIVQAAGGEAAQKVTPVNAAKNQAAVAFNPAQLAQAESALSLAIQQLLSAAGQQEGLSTDPGFTEIRRQLLVSEKLITQATRRYNDEVHALNASISSFPYVLTAKAIGLQAQPMFGV